MRMRCPASMTIAVPSRSKSSVVSSFFGERLHVGLERAVERQAEVLPHGRDRACGATRRGWRPPTDVVGGALRIHLLEIDEDVAVGVGRARRQDGGRDHRRSSSAPTAAPRWRSEPCGLRPVRSSKNTVSARLLAPAAVPFIQREKPAQARRVVDFMVVEAEPSTLGVAVALAPRRRPCLGSPIGERAVVDRLHGPRLARGEREAQRGRGARRWPVAGRDQGPAVLRAGLRRGCARLLGRGVGKKERRVGDRAPLAAVSGQAGAVVALHHVVVDGLLVHDPVRNTP